MRSRRILQSISSTVIFTAAASHHEFGPSMHVRSWTSDQSQPLRGLHVRGGAADATKKKSKSSKKFPYTTKDEKAKNAINEKMKDDAATLMGDAIR